MKHYKKIYTAILEPKYRYSMGLTDGELLLDNKSEKRLVVSVEVLGANGYSEVVLGHSQTKWERFAQWLRKSFG